MARPEDYARFGTMRYSVSMELREVTIEMYKEMTEFILSGEWDSKRFCTKWVDIWEFICQEMKNNAYISAEDYEEYAMYAIRRIVELCDTFHEGNLYEQFLVN